MTVLACNDPQAIDAAVEAVRAGAVIVVPTDTVYGVGADPMSPAAVDALLAAKSRTRQMPPPVLVASMDDAAAVAASLTPYARTLMERFWPGALTVIVKARPDVGWDLGETHGTVALRMPDHPDTLAVLRATGPLAVTSANKTTCPPACDIAEARAQLGEAVSLYLDGGRCGGGVPSSIVRCVEEGEFEILRHGAIGDDELRAAVGLPAASEGAS